MKKLSETQEVLIRLSEKKTDQQIFIFLIKKIKILKISRLIIVFILNH